MRHCVAVQAEVDKRREHKIKLISRPRAMRRIAANVAPRARRNRQAGGQINEVISCFLRPGP